MRSASACRSQLVAQLKREGAARLARRSVPRCFVRPLQQQLAPRVTVLAEPLGHRAPRLIDLSPLERVRRASLAELSDPEYLETRLLPATGLSDDFPRVFPRHLRGRLGHGLRCWQYPSQFAHYLVELSAREVRSYIEIGVQHGGTFLLTVEYLRRFTPLERAVAVDMFDVPVIPRYARSNPGVRFLKTNSRSARFATFLRDTEPFDLALIDGDHSRHGVARDMARMDEHARLLAFHDIVGDNVPGVGAVWRELRRTRAAEFEFHEFAQQYAEVVRRTGARWLGLGLAVRKRSGRAVQ
jgi:hypothetical protein